MMGKRNYCELGKDGVYRCNVEKKWESCIHYFSGNDDDFSRPCVFIKKLMGFDFMCVGAAARQDARKAQERGNENGSNS